MTEFTLKAVDEDYVPREERFKRTVLPEGRKFLVTVEEAEVEPSPFLNDKNDPDSGKRDWVKFKFSVIDDNSMTDEEIEEYVGTPVWGNTSTAFYNHPDCKLRQWIMGILGVDDLPDDFKVDLEDLVGQVAGITVYHKEGKTRTGEQRTYVNVADVIPAHDVDTIGGLASDQF